MTEELPLLEGEGTAILDASMPVAVTLPEQAAWASRVTQRVPGAGPQRSSLTPKGPHAADALPSAADPHSRNGLLGGPKLACSPMSPNISFLARLWEARQGIPRA